MILEIQTNCCEFEIFQILECIFGIDAFHNQQFEYFEPKINNFSKMDHTACWAHRIGIQMFLGKCLHFRLSPLIDCNVLVQAKTRLMGRNIQWFNRGFTVVRVHDGALGQIPHLLHLPRRVDGAYHVSFLSRELKFEHIKGGALDIEYNIFSSFRKIQFK